jgi:DNA-directed RNA polymerase specialized sigma24 family protein
MELRYFGGLSEQEVAALLSISRSTVTREWQTARTWLYRRMTNGPDRVARG